MPFADQTRAQVTWDDDVVAYWRMIGYENRVTSDESFVEDRKEFAEIPMGAATTVFFEVQLKDDVLRDRSNVADLGDVHLRWVTPMSGLTNRQSASHELPQLRPQSWERQRQTHCWSSAQLWRWPPTDTPAFHTWTAGSSSEIRHDLQLLSRPAEVHWSTSSNTSTPTKTSTSCLTLLIHAALPSDTRTQYGLQPVIGAAR